MRTLPAVMAAVLAVWAAPAVSAQTAVLPERPGYPGLLFIDNPAIVDPHPMRAESFNRVVGDRAVGVHFTTGTPQCYGVHATVQETPETVTVELLGGTLPEAVDRPCILIAVAGILDVPLQNPLGSRQVLTALPRQAR
ncbi:hypothetical protein AU184_22220 [Mycolicibacterium novocastrense]|uniref:hypothetical protein n=1 Tax=Mycolicibacterium novocastrense TaxID=59813 RepID=UPI00074883CE|nr:hypothetical protein [Mycolicibacterium novocastrense]KUH65371.1 hypothetical protein AU183_21105 [Mycolicibacterium novocastrense]KUH75565.1 hypothetical protein AU072_20950 [Mycolicibacterium novocastrense]KUH77876.1 hypothetical protein AU184_22220 [Mycolicibacterium novocastrense]